MNVVCAGPLDSEGAVTQIPASSGNSAKSTQGEVADVTKAVDDLSLVHTHSSTMSNENKDQVTAARFLAAEQSRSTVSSASSGSNRGSILSSLRRRGVSPGGSLDGLDVSLQPLPPAPGSQLSAEVYADHCRLADEYLDTQRKILNAQQER